MTTTFTLPRDLLDQSVNGFEHDQGRARNQIRELLAAPVPPQAETATCAKSQADAKPGRFARYFDTGGPNLGQFQHHLPQERVIGGYQTDPIGKMYHPFDHGPKGEAPKITYEDWMKRNKPQADAQATARSDAAELQQYKDWLSQLERYTGIYIPRGQELSKTDFPELFKAMSPEGSTVDFKLPDLSGQLIKHADTTEAEALAIQMRQMQVTHAKERDTLRAQLAEMIHRAGDVVEGFDGKELPGAMTMRIRKLKAALSTASPATINQQGEGE